MENQDKRCNIYGLTFWISVLMAALGLTGLAFVPVSQSCYLDMLAVPVIIGSMIGAYTQHSYAPSIILSAIWAAIAVIYSPVCTSTAVMIISRLPIGPIAAFSYQLLRKDIPRGRFNAFWASAIALFARACINAIIGIIHHQPQAIKIATQNYILETIFTITILLTIIDKLRSMHLLNGDYLNSKRGALFTRRYIISQEDFCHGDHEHS
jgi:hypothetical protein